MQIQTILGDCFEELARLPDHSVHLIATDLPYGTTACLWDTPLDLPAMWKEVRRVLKPNGTFISTACHPFTTILAASNLEQLKYSLVWEKTRASNFVHCWNRPMQNHEDILIFSTGSIVQAERIKNSMTYNPQGLHGLPEGAKSRNGNALGLPSHYAATEKKKSSRRMTYNPQGVVELAEPIVHRTTNQVWNGKSTGGKFKPQTYTNFPRTIQKFGSVGKAIHNTQKPVDLYEWLIRTYSNPGDVVMDICAGSFTTAIACVNVGERHFIGIEKDPAIFGIGETRLNEHLKDIARTTGVQ